MAFPTVTITCAYAGASSQRQSAQDILGKLNWQEAPSTGVSTTNAAPAAHDTAGNPIFRVRSNVDIWFAYGAAPNAASGPRVPVVANVDYDFYVEPGNKGNWVAA